MKRQLTFDYADNMYSIFEDGTKVFSVLNGKSQNQINYDTTKFTNNKSAKNYYKEAYNLKNFMEQYRLNEITVDNKNVKNTSQTTQRIQIAIVQ